VYKIRKTAQSRTRAHANLYGNYTTATINNGVISSPVRHSSRNLFFRKSHSSRSAISLSIYESPQARFNPDV